MYKGINTTLDEGQTPIVTTGGGFDAAATHRLVMNWDGQETSQTLTNRLYGGMGAQQMPDKGNLGAVLVQTLQATNPMAVAFTTEQTPKASSDVAFTITKGSPSGGGHPQAAMTAAMQVRRLTPVECERLQGFPDGYTNIPWRGKPESPDGPRYKALGNSMAVPCMVWIGERINKVEAL